MKNGLLLFWGLLVLSACSIFNKKRGEKPATENEIHPTVAYPLDTTDITGLLPKDSLDKTIGRVEGPISNNLFTNLVADRCLAAGTCVLLFAIGMPCHACLLPPNNIRSIAKGPEITVRDICETSPTNCKLYIVKINGSAMDSLLVLLAHSASWAVAGIELTSENHEWKMAKIRNIPFDSRQEYYLVVTEEMVLNHPKYPMLAHPQLKLNIGRNIRDATILQLQNEFFNTEKTITDPKQRIINTP